MKGNRALVARALANGFVSATWTEASLVECAARILGRRPRWVRPLVRRVLAGFGSPPPRPHREVLARFVWGDASFVRAWRRGRRRPRVARHDLLPSVFEPVSGRPGSWDLPVIATAGALADWLEVSATELEWLADRFARLPRACGHYQYDFRRRSRGGWRVVESPLPRTKAIQRRILREVLDRIPPHDAAHGFRRGRSAVTFAAAHAGQEIVVRLDLANFFPSIPASRVHALFATAGYPETVARLLTAVCTHIVPAEVVHERDATGRRRLTWHERQIYRAPHLPQGAPTSPALANLCALRLDRRLAAAARTAGATYGRYADDLAFSGPASFARCAHRFHILACVIAAEEGFRVETRKTRLMRTGARQRLAGVVINEHPNIARREYDRLRAILHNCARTGPGLQNREGDPAFRDRLRGHIAHVCQVNPRRGARLRELYDGIPWSDST